MARLKPLPEKSVAALYEKTGLTVKEREYLNTLFTACANLYGRIQMREVWDVHKELKNVPKIQRKQMLAFAAVARRDGNLPYYVIDGDELWSDVDRSELSREIVHKALIGSGHARLFLFNDLVDSYNEGIPNFVPQNLLEYANPVPSKEETDLLDFLNELEVTADMSIIPYGSEYPCENKGKRLKEFSFLTKDEKYMLEYYEKQPKMKEAYLAELSGTEAEKIMRMLKKYDTIGKRSGPEIFRQIMEELDEVGVELTDEQFATLFFKATVLHNSSHLWCLFGWSPNELRKEMTGEDDEFSKLDLATLLAGIDAESEDDDLDADWIPVQVDEVDETDLQRRMREHGFRLID